MTAFAAALRRRPLSAALLVVVLMACALAVWMLQARSTPPQYLTAKVGRGSMEEAVNATGIIRPSEQVAVGAQVSGQLKSLKVKLGDRVKRGQLLAIIDPELQNNELKRAEGALADIRATRKGRRVLLRQYQAEERRQAAMLGTNATSSAEYEAALANVESTQAAIDSLTAQVAVARVGVDTARTNLGFTRILAPIDGDVIAVISREGQTLVSAQVAPVILVIANLDVMTVRAKISEADVIRIQPGLPAYFSILGAPDSRFETTLNAVEPTPESIVGEVTAQQYQQTPQQNSSAVYYNGLFDVPNPGHRLRASMTAQVSIVLGKAAEALTVPVAALGKRLAEKKYEVRVLVGDRVEMREVTLGLINDSNAQVLGGLSAGEDVIVGDSLSASIAAAAAAAQGR